MKGVGVLSSVIITILLLFTGGGNNVYAQPESLFRGIVFHDRNGNSVFDKGQDKPLKNVAVSNGRDVVVTNRKGIYELPYRDDAPVFVVKPRNWMVPVSENQLPGFYYMHSVKGISGNKFDGLPSSGPAPDFINFPLLAQKEPDKIKVVVFGDTQTRDDKEIYYMSQKIMPELVNVDAHFGITLGDVVFDDLNIYDHLVSAISTAGIPWWYAPGNHDLDYTGNNTTQARGTWNRVFGPSYYSFTCGPAHFIVLDDVRWIVEENKRYYLTGLGADQMEFIKNEIQRLDKDQLLVLLSHIPYDGSTEWYDREEKQAFYQLIASHPNSLSLAAHTHKHFHRFLSEEHGFPGTEPHHAISMGTVCGAWWSGVPDEYGIPHAMMADGTPNSYGLLHIDGNNWKLAWKAAGKPENYQMHIDAPEVVPSGTGNEIKITANIFNALPDARVKMRIGKEGEWMDMARVPQLYEARQKAIEAEKNLGEVPWRKMGATQFSEHIWEARQNINLEPGVYVIEVSSKDSWGEYHANRLIHVK